MAISAAFTAAIMTLHVATADRVTRNESLRKEKALVEIFGLGDPKALSSDEIARLVASRIKPAATIADPTTGETLEIIRAYDRPHEESDAQLIGVAFPVSGMGFWASIHGLMAVTPDGNRALGIIFLSHSETPGLGARIDDASFRDDFRGHNMIEPPPGGRYVYIGRGEPVGPADPKTGRSVDAITGATQTSVAVERLLETSIRRFKRVYQPPRATEEAP